MAIRRAPPASAVVRPAISINRRTFANIAACSGVGSGATISVMQGSSREQDSSRKQGSSRQQGASLEQGSSSISGQRLQVIVAGDEGSTRLDRVLAVRLAELSRSRLKALILAGQGSILSVTI